MSAPVVYATTPEKDKVEQTAEMTEVSGVVFDAATLAPLAGVRVVAHGNSRYAAMTNEEGTYSLRVPNYVTLLDLTAPGYNLVQVAASKQSQVIYIYSEEFAADYVADVRVTDVAEANDFSLSTALAIDQEISKRLSGDVRTITRSGTPAMGSAMFIGGLNSLNANAQPLIVVDGVFLDQQYGREALHEGYYNNVLPC